MQNINNFLFDKNKTVSKQYKTHSHKMTEPAKDNLEKHIDEVSNKIEIPLIKHETTPGVGNCWYEACASLLKLNNMRKISAKQLRKEVVDNIEYCDNFPTGGSNGVLVTSEECRIFPTNIPLL